MKIVHIYANWDKLPDAVIPSASASTRGRSSCCASTACAGRFGGTSIA